MASMRATLIRRFSGCEAPLNIRHNLYFDREVSEAMKAIAAGPGGNMSRLVNDALRDWLGLVTDLCRSPISLCHLGLECEGADAAQI
jgi:hypothetical protein